MNINVRMPDQVHRRLTEYKNRRRPHMSLNALIVDAVMEYVGDADDDDIDASSEKAHQDERASQ